MSSKKEIKLLTELLNLPEVKVISHRQHQGIGIILQIERTLQESICPRCGTKSHRLHQPKPSICSQRFVLGRATSIFRNK